MKLIFFILATLFALKLIWNIGVPVDIFLRSRRGQIKAGSGVSLMPPVEILLLIALFVCSFFINADNFFYQPTGILLVGGGGMVLSYSWIFVMLIIQVWKQRRK